MGDFNFYLSFTIMTCLPIGILLLAIINYYGSISYMSHNLANLTEVQRKFKTKEALHALFALADSNHDGSVNPSELVELLRSLGLSIRIEQAMVLAKKIGVNSPDTYDYLELEEVRNP